jgi:hypothetical protein
MTNTRFGRINLREFAAHRSSLAAAAAACLCLAVLAAESHASRLPSWRAVKQAGLASDMLIPAKSDFSVASASGPSGTPLPLRIVLPENPTASYSFLMFRNLPAQFRLSAGFGTKTYWAVSLNDIQGLEIVPPDDYVGTLALEVLLIKTMGSDPERAVANMTFQPNANRGRVLTATPANDGVTAALPETAAPKPFAERLPSGDAGGAKAQRQARAVEEPLPDAAPPPQAQPVSMSEADRALMDRGDVYLKQGDVASARLIYRQVARREIAEGAYAMGSTYDPEYLASLGVRGLKPDIAEARKWYEKAQSLGSQEAGRRLAVIGQR